MTAATAAAISDGGAASQTTAAVAAEAATGASWQRRRRHWWSLSASTAGPAPRGCYQAAPGRASSGPARQGHGKCPGPALSDAEMRSAGEMRRTCSADVAQMYRADRIIPGWSWI